jgi:histidinol-phosphate aminotransferase
MTCDYVALANRGVQLIQPYQPGRSAEDMERALGVTDIIKLASNENPNGPCTGAIEACKRELQGLNIYADNDAFDLKQALSARLGVPAARLTTGSGSSELLDMIAKSYLSEGDEAVYSQYGFIYYSITIKKCNATEVSVPADGYGHDLDAMDAAVTDKTRLVFIANPNNPTGTWVTHAQLQAFMQGIPENVLVVVDEAYCEYQAVDDLPDSIAIQKQHPNLIITRTFSKAYGLAGLRVGYAIANEQVTDILNRTRPPFNVNKVANAAALAALQDDDYLQTSRELNKQGMAQLQAGLEAMGIKFIPSAGNFITVRGGDKALEIHESLQQQGIIIRPLVPYGMPDHLRITVGLPEQNERLLTALRGLAPLFK